MRENRLRAQIGYKRRYMKGGKLGSIAGNILDRKFSPDMPNQAWVSDMVILPLVTEVKSRELCS